MEPRRPKGPAYACTVLVLAAMAAACAPSQGVDAGDVHVGVDVSATETAAPCASDDDCDNGVFCDGRELCRPGTAGTDARGCVAPAARLDCGANRRCDESSSRCITDCAQSDADRDGHAALECPGGDDCDDGDANRYPGNVEVCDSMGHDEDCDSSTVDRRDRASGRSIDGDRDGDGSIASTCCNATADGARTCGPDCDDARANVNPRSVEVCDGVDNNCDGAIDEGVPQISYYPDCDGDMFGRSGSTATVACTPPATAPACASPTGTPSWSDNASDCDDDAGGRNPGQPETCDGVDNDCDGMTDEAPAGGACLLAPEATSMQCTAGACAVATCRSGRGDCDGSAGNGCETDTRTSNANCGACGVACAVTNGTARCVAGGCVADTCVAGFHPCGAVCATDTAIETCGTSCLPCAPPAHASPTCDGTACGFVCDAGFHRCGAACADDSAPATCGALCTPCPTPANAAPTCNAGTCGFACLPGYVAAGPLCVPGPRPIAPLSGSRVSTRTPPLAWELPNGADGAHVDLCRDRDCTSVIASFDVSGSTGRPTAPLPAGPVFWRASATTGTTVSPIHSFTWSFIVPPRDAPRENAFPGPLDSNGDGFADLAVSTTYFARNGRVRVFSGGPSAITAGLTNVAILDARHAGEQFGLGVSAAGDVNGDGYGDLVIGGPDASRMGFAYVYLGSRDGIANGDRPVAQIPNPVAGGYEFGWSVAGLGDIDGDGYGDIAVGAPYTGDGRVFVFRGGPTGIASDAIPSVTLLGSNPSSQSFGETVAAAGDVDGDGRADLVVGGEDEGTEVFLSSMSGLVDGAAPSAVLMASVGWSQPGITGAVDFDGDGYCDVAVGTHATSDARVFLGAGIRLGGMMVPSAHLQPAAFHFFGYSVGAGDVNADGYDDLVVGEISGGTGGTSYLYVGGAAGIADGASPSVTLEPTRGGSFGTASYARGDLDGDGHCDIAVTAEYALMGAGALYVWRGTSTGVADPMTPDLFIGGSDGTNVSFGGALACVHSTRRFDRQRASARGRRGG